MATLRTAKLKIKQQLEAADWQDQLAAIASLGPKATGALFSLLLAEPALMHRTACALGATVAAIYKNNPEAGKNLIRRYLWQMNEDSGNIGWGIPCAFAETLAQNEDLAQNYGSILLSYIMDLGFADNYCDHAPLRRECYWAVGRFAQAWPLLAAKARPWLVKGLADEDSICRGMAAWALARLPPSLMDAPALKKLATAGDDDICQIFSAGKMAEFTVSQLASMALGAAGPQRVLTL